jgi:hypothetical protein
VRPPPAGAELTLSGYEFYPQALANTIRWAHAAIGKPIYVTESGIATNDDARRIAFIDQALDGVRQCLDEGIPVHSYLYWSLLDNFEWTSGYGVPFGLVAVDRKTFKRTPRPSALHLGRIARASILSEIVAGAGGHHLGLADAGLGIDTVEAELLAAERAGYQVGHHHLQVAIALVGEGRDQVDQPDAVPRAPFLQGQAVLGIDQAAGQFAFADGVGLGPQGQADGPVAVPEDVELLVQKGGHNQPFQVADRQSTVQGRLGQEPGHLAQQMADRRCGPSLGVCGHAVVP